LLKNPNNEFYDPIISGFDLDAITALYLKSDKNNSISEDVMNSSENTTRIITKPNSLLDYLLKLESENGKIELVTIYDLLGKKVIETNSNFQQLAKFLTKIQPYLISVKFANSLISKNLYCIIQD
jgi:hypothetical protein